MTMTIESAATRVLQRSRRTPSGCLIFEGCVDSNGYGRAMVTTPEFRRAYLVHRLVYESVHGVIPEGVVIRHGCDTPPCVEIDHLLAGTQADNIRDMWERGRQNPSWPPNPNPPRDSPLTPEQMKELLAPESRLIVSTHFARKFGVSARTIRKIRKVQ